VARVTRPMLHRDGPIRSWIAAVNPDIQTPSADSSRAGAEPRLDSQDPIVRGVVSGGRVVDEWMRQAQQTARLLGGTTSNGGVADASGRMFKMASDFTAAWWAMLGVPFPTGGAPFPNGGAAATPPGAAPVVPAAPAKSAQPQPSSVGPQVTFEVASRHPVEITVDLHKQGCTEFQVLDLRSERGRARRIRGTALEARDGRGLRLRLAVPDTQPAGTYHGVILDPAADCAVGTVTLRIRR
jgi:hypothetical protein